MRRAWFRYGCLTLHVHGKSAVLTLAAEERSRAESWVGICPAHCLSRSWKQSPWSEALQDAFALAFCDHEDIIIFHFHLVKNLVMILVMKDVRTGSTVKSTGSCSRDVVGFNCRSQTARHFHHS